MKHIVTLCSGAYARPHAKAASVDAVIRPPYRATSLRKPRDRIASCGLLGGRRMTSGSPGSMASASAGNVSVTMLIQRICSGNSGAGRFAIPVRSSTRISARLQLKR